MLIWIGVFLSTALADMAWTRYFLETENRNAVKAAFWSAMIVALGAFTTIQFVHNVWMLTASLAGAYVGTFYTVKFAKAK